MNKSPYTWRLPFTARVQYADCLAAAVACRLAVTSAPHISAKGSVALQIASSFLQAAREIRPRMIPLPA